MQQKPKIQCKNLELPLLLVLVVLYFSWFSWPAIWTASENERIVSVFNPDEYYFLNITETALRGNTLKLHYITYGHFYVYTALVPLLNAVKFFDVSQQSMIVTLRVITIFSGILTVVLTFLLARRFFDSITAWLSVFFLSVVSLSFLTRSVIAQTDVPQLFFIVLSIFFCCLLIERYRLRWLILASVLACLAFACKYVGILVLPIILFVVVVRTISGDNAEDVFRPSFFPRNSRVMLLLLRVIAVFFTFVLTFILVSPEPTVRSLSIKGISTEYGVIKIGQDFRNEAPNSEWFVYLISGEMLDDFISLFVMVGLIRFLWELKQKPREMLLSPTVIMWLWVILFFGLLFIDIKMRGARLLLPILPFLVILASREITRMLDFIFEKTPKKSTGSLMLGTALLLIIVFIELPRVNAVVEYHNIFANREKNSLSVAAGNWLAQNYPPSTRILYDYYSYVPPSFPNAQATWGGTIRQLELFKPDVVIVNKKISRQFSNISDLVRYTGGTEEKFKERFKYYSMLREGALNYSLVKDFSNEIQVYEKVVVERTSTA